eukprot:12422619-Karenia_brevis.AAC.1
MQNAMRSLRAAIDAVQLGSSSAPTTSVVPEESEPSLSARLAQPLEVEVQRQFGNVEVLSQEAESHSGGEPMCAAPAQGDTVMRELEDVDHEASDAELAAIARRLKKARHRSSPY